MEIPVNILRQEEVAALKLRALYQEAGFNLFCLKSFEEYNFYLENKNFLADDDVIKFSAADGRLLALNPDVTLSIVKNTAAHESRRLYYNENIYRHNHHTNEYQQLNQAGIEIIGSVDKQAELEVIQLAIASLEVIGQAKLEFSHSGLVAAILALFPCNRQAEVFSSIKNKDSAALKDLAQQVHLAPALTTNLCELLQLSGEINESLQTALTLTKDLPHAHQALVELQELATALLKEAVTPRLLFDLSTVNDTNYYSGIIFQGFVPQVPQAILFGGRYDGLLQSLGKTQAAIGFGIHLNAIATDTVTAKNERTHLNIALPKGRMGEKVYHMFHEAGLCQENLLDESRKLIFTDEENGLRFFLVKPSDVASYVEHGAADIGIVGRDILLETEADVLDVLRFAIGQCDIAIAGAKNFQKDASRPLKVATKYPTITRKYFSSRSQPVELIYLNGSIELAPLVGLADVIVDIVETGTTLKENGLEVFEKITDSSAHLVVNRTSWRFKQSEIYEIIQKVGAKND